MAGMNAGVAGDGHVCSTSAAARGESPEQPWLSILVPVYNVRPFVEACLASIIAQVTGQGGVELVIVDDCSTDGSADLCRHVLDGCDIDSRLLRHDQNRGIGVTRNILLEAARGDYLWFVDSDDMLLPGAIAGLRDVVLEHGPDVVLCDYVREKGRPFATFCGRSGVESGVPMQCTETLIAGTFARRRLHAWSKVWRRDLFGDAIRFPEGASFEDVATVPWLLLGAKSFVYMAQPWIYYRTRKTSIMAQLNCRGRFDHCGNDELAVALQGFSRALAQRLPEARSVVDSAVAEFWAREFVKIVKRLARSGGVGMQGRGWSAFQAEARRYRALMEASSPQSFDAVMRDYLRKGRIVRGGALALSLAVAMPRRISVNAELSPEA